MVIGYKTAELFNQVFYFYDFHSGIGDWDLGISEVGEG